MSISHKNANKFFLQSILVSRDVEFNKKLNDREKINIYLCYI
jgi:hypothetical protein